MYVYLVEVSLTYESDVVQTAERVNTVHTLTLYHDQDMHSFPAWSAFLTANLINRIQSTIKKLYLRFWLC